MTFLSGRQSRVKFEKEYFIGKAALQKQLETGVTKRLVQLTLTNDHDAENDVWPYGGKSLSPSPIYKVITVYLWAYFQASQFFETELGVG